MIGPRIIGTEWRAPKSDLNPDFMQEPFYPMWPVWPLSPEHPMPFSPYGKTTTSTNIVLDTVDEPSLAERVEQLEKQVAKLQRAVKKRKGKRK